MKMKLIFRLPLFLLLLLLLQCAEQMSGVTIESDPAVSRDGVIQTELEKVVSLLCLPGNRSEAEAEAEAEAELVWLRNDQLVRLTEENRKDQSRVCVTPVIYDDNGANFTCFLSGNDTVRASVVLNVTFPPQLSGSEQVLVEDMDDLVLRCDIWANPAISSVLWTLNGTAVDLTAGRFTRTNDGFSSWLSTSGVKRSLHEGTYQCTVVSSMYGEHSKSFHVTVTEKTIKFPLMPMIAGLVVVCLTTILAVLSRWHKIVKCVKSCRK
ncbi:hypothetical protein JOB18_017346 [Solea senegalensis]|uniref:Ig-like domain-containing protein n=1 Tax=Solea senegalensis TaxID=28829 RepID=A0AAV6SGB7_SOLSE|nr:transmembrane and immunoglobulin domain-containing protein 1 [Solea senegalensis]KAG7515854.1 transmembrane and immunoglobulin domain-containing protein 1-like [Solea senegalensis]KAG7515855.1 hypothetical protein JOB18_017346 [Solea senegalensis]KAG7515857.1 hypothetical protein JOB18_017346 [Solea senegalensis]KAG7515858.1 hypothetical protein JOB18_017346 [Solea senegalensis]